MNKEIRNKRNTWKWIIQFRMGIRGIIHFEIKTYFWMKLIDGRKSRMNERYFFFEEISWNYKKKEEMW